MTVEQVLADLRGEAAVLRHNGHAAQADTLERACALVTAAIPEYLLWLTEEEARRRSGWPVARLRGLFSGWLDSGMARWVGRKREYRAAALPLRPNEDAARAEGLRDARKLAS